MTNAEDDEATARAYLGAFLHDQTAQAAEDDHQLLEQAVAAARAEWEGHGRLSAATTWWFRSWVDGNALSAGAALHGRGAWTAYDQALADVAAVDRWLTTHDFTGRALDG